MLWTHYRAKVASLSRDRSPDDPELVEARQQLAECRLADEIRRRAPGLTPVQRSNLAKILAASS